MRLDPIDGADPRAVLRALRAALDGTGPALGLGMLSPVGREVTEGTAAVITTSGSTGVPKSVVLGRDALVASAAATAARLGGAGAWLLALPAGYVAGLQVLVRSLLAGHDPVLMAGPFRAAEFARAAVAMAPGVGSAPRYTSLVPAQLSTLLDAADHDDAVAHALRSFAAILIGGQALPPSILDRAHAAGARIVRTYGSTETSGGCVYDGRPLDGVEVAIVAGEVRVSGATLASGYLDDPGLTDAVFVRDAGGTRWYRTGDAGSVEGGVLRVHGRIDNVIVSGGVNVSLDRVERVVRGIAGLESAVVVGVADGRWGEASVVVVPRAAMASGAEPAQLARVRAAVAAEIGAPARPARLVTMDALPALASGKPDRAAIRRTLADPR